jgi:hypothetical protein
VRLSPLGTAATTGLLYQPQMTNDGDCGAIGAMKIGRGNRRTWRKPTPVPLWRPQSPHDLARARTRATVLGSHRLTFCAMPRPSYKQLKYILTTWQMNAMFLFVFYYFRISYTYTTSRKVAGSIPNVTGFFSWPNPSGRTMALGSTGPLT